MKLSYKYSVRILSFYKQDSRRSGERVQNSFAISFMADKKVKHCLIKKEGRLFLIGTAQFESLVDLVAHYEKNPLYKKVKLKTPVTEELLARRGNLSPGVGEAGGYSGEGYMDPNLFTSTTCARAQYEYKARRDDELSFPAGALITNVSHVRSCHMRHVMSCHVIMYSHITCNVR